MQKILFCTESFNVGVGGVASYAHDFIDAFKCNYLFSVVTDDQYNKTDEEYPVYEIKLDDFSQENIKRFLHVIEIESPDIIINSNYTLVALLAPYLPDSIKIFSISHFTDGKLALRAGINANYLDGVIALSTYAKQHLIKKFHIHDPNKVSIVYNCMPAVDEVDTYQKKNEKVLKIVYPGGRAYPKSPDMILSLLYKLVRSDLKFEFYWLGYDILPLGKNSFMPFKKISDFAPLDPRIKKVGKVDRNEAQEILSSTNIFLLPSRGEGCPITLLEAMRGGCIPVISDAHHGSLDLIEDKKTGFVTKQGDLNSLYSTIVDIINNHETYNYIYDNTIKEFYGTLESRHWKRKMQVFLEQPLSHKKRIHISRGKLFMDIVYIKLHYLKYELKSKENDIKLLCKFIDTKYTNR